MTNNIEFKDFSLKVKNLIEAKAIKFLHEASGVLVSQAVDNSRYDEGTLSQSWDYTIDKSKMEAQVGSPLENAIWEEYGTGEYADGGKGRKGGWVYTNRHGKKVFTFGKYPNHTLERAFDSQKNAIIRQAKKVFKEIN